MEDVLSTTRSDRRILVTLPDVAWPVDGGKRLRVNGVLRGLAAAGQVDVAFLFSTAPEGVPPVPDDVPVHEWMRISPPARGRLPGVARSLARGVPTHIGAQRWDLVREQLAAWADREYDLVWFGGLDHARGLRDVLHAPHRVVDCDDVETEKWRAFLAADGGGRVERLQRRVELGMWGRIQHDVAGWADAVAVCSDLDAQRFGPGPTVVVPNTYPRPAGQVDLSGALRHPEAPRLLMIANWGTDQNVDAAHYAAHEVLPAVRRLLPGARLRLAGRRPERIADVAGVEGVDLVGAVDDVAEELTAADVTVVPMRFGGGTRLKVLEAFAHGTPVVSTTLGAEGLSATDGEQLLLGDTPEAFAAAVQRVVTDPVLRQRLVTSGAALYEAAFTPEVAVAGVTALVDRLLD